MPVDPAHLTDRKWLDLFGATTYLALGEALSIEALRWFHYPSTRVWLPQIKSAWERCRDEASGMRGGYSEFLKMINSYSRDPFHPPPSGVLRNIASWPPSGRFLYEYILNWEQAHDQDESARVTAEPLILQAFLSDKVLFRGNRGGREECIVLLRCEGAPRFDFYNSTIEASASEPDSDGGRTLKWTSVNIDLGRLVKWLNDQRAVQRAPMQQRTKDAMASNTSKRPSSEPDDEGLIPEFRDVPTSDNETVYISYFDVMLWIADQLVGFEESDHRDTWDEAQRQIRRLCELGDLIAYGLPYQDASDGLPPIPSSAWPRLWLSIMDGQPDDDLGTHGGRGYGKAYWKDRRDENRRTDAWDGVCFLKRDVLQHWPARGSETVAITSLAEQYKRNPELSRAAALTWCQEQGFGLSGRAFQNRVMPQAREQAGLPAKTPPGRKPSSSR